MWASGKVWYQGPGFSSSLFSELYHVGFNPIWLPLLAPGLPLMVTEYYPAPDLKYRHITLPKGLSEKSHQICPHISLTLPLEVERRFTPTDHTGWKWRWSPQEKNQDPFASRVGEKHSREKTRAGLSHRNPKHVPKAPKKEEEHRWLLKKKKAIWFLI